MNVIIPETLIKKHLIPALKEMDVFNRQGNTNPVELLKLEAGGRYTEVVKKVSLCLNSEHYKSKGSTLNISKEDVYYAQIEEGLEPYIGTLTSITVSHRRTVFFVDCWVKLT